MDRSAYRREVERLLAQIDEWTRELQVLRAYGARAAALRDRKKDLRHARMELAVLTAAGS
ncbi:MAG: hypothetical protein KGL94_12845 [Acidobacteriota bacterium]|nr:hypothetical protein [Acidobacteriota bacterium]